jgi:predicted ATPase
MQPIAEWWKNSECPSTRSALPTMGSIKAKQYDQAMERANLAIATSSEIGDRWCLPRIHAVIAHLHQIFHEIEKAEERPRAAIEIATQQSAKGLQLHAAIQLGRLWRDQGKVQQARELLAPVYGWFTEGVDTRDLKEAKALLEELGGHE